MDAEIRINRTVEHASRMTTVLLLSLFDIFFWVWRRKSVVTFETDVLGISLLRQVSVSCWKDQKSIGNQSNQLDTAFSYRQGSIPKGAIACSDPDYSPMTKVIERGCDATHN
jgi:hypothetical protein